MTTRINDHHTHSRKRNHEHANLQSQGRPSRGARNPNKQRRYSQHPPTSPSTLHQNKHPNTGAAHRKSPSPSSLHSSAFPEIEPGIIGFQRPPLSSLPLPVLSPPGSLNPVSNVLPPASASAPLTPALTPTLSLPKKSLKRLLICTTRVAVDFRSRQIVRFLSCYPLIDCRITATADVEAEFYARTKGQ